MEKVIKQSQCVLAGAADLLSESRVLQDSLRGKPERPIKTKPRQESPSKRNGAAWQEETKSPSNKERLLEISLTANRIVEELSGTCKSLMGDDQTNVMEVVEKTQMLREVSPTRNKPKKQKSQGKARADSISSSDVSMQEPVNAVLPVAPTMASGTGDSQDHASNTCESDPSIGRPDPSGTGGTNEQAQVEEEVPAAESQLKMLLAKADEESKNDKHQSDFTADGGLQSLGQQLERSNAEHITKPEKEYGDETSNLPKEAVDRLRGAFHFFTEPFSYDLDVCNLQKLVKYLGHGVTKATAEGIRNIVQDLTPYEYLDFDEFLSFMEKFLVFEYQQNKKMFNSYDDDGSGELSVLELRQVMRSLDILPLNGKVKEAINIVDRDCNGQLEFEEFQRFLHIYQSNEGFTKQELVVFKEIFAKLASSEQGHLPLTSICDALVLFFGVSLRKECKALEQKLIDRQKSRSTSTGKSDVPEGLTYEGLLLLARELRELYYTDLIAQQMDTDRDTFLANDADGNSMISESEMCECLTKLGYFPLAVCLHEVFGEVVGTGKEQWTEGAELDFDQFFDFILVYRQREGFLKAEVEYLSGVFNRFDEDTSGSISTLELLDILRHLGYFLDKETIERYILQVDENQSHTLDFKEFLNLMQLHRSRELRDMNEAFKEHCADKSLAQLPAHKMWNVLEDIGYKDRKEIEELIASAPGDSLDFGSFVCLADRCRAHVVGKLRRMAGFTAAEIERLEENFNTFDKDKSGTITCFELLRVLEAFGWKPKTHEDRDDIMGRLAKARNCAREAGVENSTEEGSAEVNFWEFVQLARMIQRHDDMAHEEVIQGLAEELQFSSHEAAEFHEVFLNWAREGHQDSSDEEFSRQCTGDDEEKTLHKDVARRIVRSLGVKFTQESKRLFDAEVDHLAGDGHTLDFPAFLRLMRWLLDTHFLE